MDMADGRERRDARLRLGNTTLIGEETRAVGIVQWLDSTLRDTRYALRQLRRSPALTSAVVLSMAIGLGSNAAIFILIDAALLRPLPYRSGFPPHHRMDQRRVSSGRQQHQWRLQADRRRPSSGLLRVSESVPAAGAFPGCVRGGDRGRRSECRGHCGESICRAGQSAVCQRKFLSGSGTAASCGPALPRR